MLINQDPLEVLLEALSKLKIVAITDPKKVIEYYKECNEYYEQNGCEDLFDERLNNYIKDKTIFYIGATSGLAEILLNPDSDEPPADDYYISYLNTENIKDWKLLGEPREGLEDSYGGHTFKLGKTYWDILNVYGEEDEYPFGVIYCACFLNRQRTALIIGDIVLTENNTLAIENRQDIKIPPKLRHPELGEGKRAFYYYRDEKKVSLRCTHKLYNFIPELYHHKDAEDWASSPRVFVWNKDQRVPRCLGPSKNVLDTFYKSTPETFRERVVSKMPVTFSTPESVEDLKQERGE